MNDKIEIAFKIVTKGFYGKRQTKIVIKDPLSICDFLHIGYTLSDGYNLVITGSNIISKTFKEKFYTITRKEMLEFKKLASSTEENYNFGIKILKNLVNYEK